MSASPPDPVPASRVFPRLPRPWLAPAAWVYGRVALARRRRLERGALCVSRPVVSVGNITCGGTGKTPTVARVVRDLTHLGCSPAILSRGYGKRYAAVTGSVAARGQRAGEIGNDEFHVLAASLPDVPHFQDPDRSRAAAKAIAAGADVLVLDDGFQHVRLARDLDIVLVDALAPFGGGRVLPAGLLREPLAVLECADLFAITRTELADEVRLATLDSYLARRFPRVPRVWLQTRAVDWSALAGGQVEPRALAGRRALAFCGIGNPAAFLRQVEALGVRLLGELVFADHHSYAADDVSAIAARARELGVDEVILTQKDAVKIAVDERTHGWRFLRIEAQIARGEDVYRAALRDAVAGVDVGA